MAAALVQQAKRGRDVAQSESVQSSKEVGSFETLCNTRNKAQSDTNEGEFMMMEHMPSSLLKRLHNVNYLHLRSVNLLVHFVIEQ